MKNRPARRRVHRETDQAKERTGDGNASDQAHERAASAADVGNVVGVESWWRAGDRDRLSIPDREPVARPSSRRKYLALRIANIQAGFASCVLVDK